MKKLLRTTIILLAIIFLSCQPMAQDIPYQVLIPGMVLNEILPPTQAMPAMFVVANKTEIVPPLPEYVFFDDMLIALNQIDFENYFAVLIRTDQNPPDPLITRISRAGDSVTIQLNEDDIRGNYELIGYSWPYQLIQVSRDGEWGKEIEFRVLDSDGNVMVSLKHFIP